MARMAGVAGPGAGKIHATIELFGEGAKWTEHFNATSSMFWQG
jgi:hypothetical protein